MKNQAEQFPNWDIHNDSPKLTQQGVNISLPIAQISHGQPVVLRGAYRLNTKWMHTMAHEPLSWLLVIVVRRDQPAGIIRAAKDGHNQPVESSQPVVDDPSVMSGGYFNLELQNMSKIITEPGRYWVMISLGDFVSNRIEFEVK